MLISSSYSEDSISSFFEMSLEELLEVQVVVAASGYEQAPTEAPASVSVVAAEQWKEMGNRTLFEAIEHVPGLHASKTMTGITYNKAVVRGLSGSFGQQSLYMLDGEPFQSISYGGLFFANRIPLIGIKRVEVVKSPGSAVYGADAFAGIINMVRYEPGEMPSEVVVRSGAFSTQDFLLSHSLGIKDSILQFSMEYSRTDGESKHVSRDQQSFFDELFGTDASNAPGDFSQGSETYSYNVHWNWSLFDLKVFSWEVNDAGVGAGVAQSLDPSGTVDARAAQYDLNMDLSDLIPIGSLDLSVGRMTDYNRTSLTIFPAGAILPIGEDGNIDFSNSANMVEFTDGVLGNPGRDAKSEYVRLVQILDIGNSHKIRWEIGHEEKIHTAFEAKNFGPGVLDGTQGIVDGTLVDVTGTAFSYLPDVERHLRYASFQDEWNLSNDISATLGVRYDDYTKLETTINPRLSLRWEVEDNLNFKFFAGTAYRAPSFIDLYTLNNPAGLGNENLRSERIETIETGFNVNYIFNDALSFSTNLFSYEADDLIEFVREPISGVQMTQNIGEQNAIGVEVSAQWRGIEHFVFLVNYSYLNSEDGFGNKTPVIPAQLAHGQVDWKPNDRWSAFLGFDWVADRIRGVNDLRPDIDNYVWGTLSVARSFKYFDARVTIDNLLNTNAREPSNGAIIDDYPLNSRSWILELGYTF